MQKAGNKKRIVEFLLIQTHEKNSNLWPLIDPAKVESLAPLKGGGTIITMDSGRQHKTPIIMPEIYKAITGHLEFSAVCLADDKPEPAGPRKLDA